MAADGTFNRGMCTSVPLHGWRGRFGVIVKQSRAHWERAFTDHDIPFAPVHSIADVVANPQVQHLGTFVEADHETEGRIVGIRNPLWLNGARSEVVPPPVLGEHSAILRGD